MSPNLTGYLTDVSINSADGPNLTGYLTDMSINSSDSLSFPEFGTLWMRLEPPRYKQKHTVIQPRQIRVESMARMIGERRPNDACDIQDFSGFDDDGRAAVGGRVW